MEYLKGNPLKAIAGILTIVGIIITSAWAADSRYNQMPQIGQIQQQMIYNQKQELEDKIFVLELRVSEGDASASDKALLHRYQNRLNNQYKMPK